MVSSGRGGMILYHCLYVILPPSPAPDFIGTGSSPKWEGSHPWLCAGAVHGNNVAFFALTRPSPPFLLSP